MGPSYLSLVLFPSLRLDGHCSDKHLGERDIGDIDAEDFKPIIGNFFLDHGAAGFAELGLVGLDVLEGPFRDHLLHDPHAGVGHKLLEVGQLEVYNVLPRVPEGDLALDC